MKQMIVVDETGFQIDSLITEDEALETDFIKNEWKDYLIKPRYDFNSKIWIESATEEELKEREREISEIERLGQQVTELELENLELNVQNEELGQQVTDIDLRVLEMELNQNEAE